MCWNKLSQEEYIRRASIKHRNEYNYSLVEYNGKDKKIMIICHEHGEFEQNAGLHLYKGAGCPKCGLLKTKTKIGLDEFINRARKLHGDRYDYSKSELKGINKQLIIICKQHGEFLQIAYHHIKGSNCPSCVNEACGDRNRKGLDEFIKEANLIHNNKYSYENVIYKNAKTKIEIICPIHGKFKQQPCEHLYGSGCIKCNESKGELRIRFLLEKNGIEHFCQYRLGNRTILDFYLPIFNCGIEYNGIQHYLPMSFTSYKEPNKLLGNFIEIYKRDERKRKFCEKEKINLLVIPFWEYSNIEVILNSLINNESPYISEMPDWVLDPSISLRKITIMVERGIYAET